MKPSEERFTARQIEQTSARGFGKYRIGVFDGDSQIGEYERNYCRAPFYAFEQSGKWYALYSRDYTATRLMSLPECVDLGGEEREAWGFCPVEYFVPTIGGFLKTDSDPEPLVANHDAKRWAHIVGRRYYWPDDKDHPEPNEEKKIAYLAEYERSHKAAAEWLNRQKYVTQYSQLGFVSGCVWGDDSGGWKLQAIDLSNLPQIKRDERFGYLELPYISLAQCIRLAAYDSFVNGDLYFEIGVLKRFGFDGKTESV